MPDAANWGDGNYGDGIYGGPGATISAVLVTDNIESPGYQITVTGIESIGGGATWTVMRVSDTTFNSGAVRGMDTVTIAGDSSTQTDYEFSFLESFTYQLNIYDTNGVILRSASTGTFSGRDAVSAIRATLNATWPQVLIRSSQQPNLNKLVSISSFSTWQINGRVLGTYNPLGRPNPVVFTDVSGGRSGTFEILIIEDYSIGAQQQDLELLLNYGDTYMFQCLYWDPRFRDMFFKVTDITINRDSLAGASETDSDSQDQMVLRYAVSFVEVDRPSTAGETVAVLTWQTVLDNFATWEDVLNAKATWLELLNNPF